MELYGNLCVHHSQGNAQKRHSNPSSISTTAQHDEGSTTAERGLYVYSDRDIAEEYLREIGARGELDMGSTDQP